MIEATVLPDPWVEDAKGTHPSIDTDRDRERAELQALVARIAADPGSWRHLVRFDGGQPHLERLWGDDLVDVWAMSFTNDHGSGSGNHDRSSGAFALVENELDQLYAEHRIFAGSGRAVSIQAYSPPLGAALGA